LLACLLGTITNELATIFGSGAYRLPGFIAGTWSIKNPGGGADT
jgi:hypothetical protein